MQLWQPAHPGCDGACITWLVAGAENEPGLVNRQLLGKLKDEGIDATLAAVTGDNFWASQEITTAPNLIGLTSERVGRWQ